MTELPAIPLPEARTRSVARNAAALAVASVLSKGILFAWQLVLIRLLTTADYGIYGTIGGMMVIAASLPEFGMGLIVLRDVAQRRELAGRMLATTLVIQPLFALVAYGGLILSGALLNYGPEIQMLLPLAGLTLFLDLLGNMVYNQLLAREQMVTTSIVSVAHIALLVALVALALLGGMGLQGLYWATIAASAARALAFWVALVRGGVGTVWPLERTIVLGLLVNSAPLAINALLGTAYQHIDKIITTASIGEANTGLLTAAFVIVAGMVELLNTTVMVAVFPMMSRQFGDGEYEAFHFLVGKLAYLTLVVVLPIGMAISLLASQIVVIFGSGYTGTTDVLSVLVWYGAIMMVGNIFSQILTIQNRQRRLLAIRASGLALNIALALLLLPRLGTPGAAVSAVITESLVVIVLMRQWERSGEWLRGLLPQLGRLAVAAGVMLGLLLALRPATLIGADLGRAVQVGLALLVGGLAYVGLTLGLGAISAGDRAFIRQVLISMPGGGLIARVWKQT